jgi:hypothetical protein
MINDRDSWAGERSLLIQDGDVIDRGTYSRECVGLLWSLQSQAPDAGGRVVRWCGNHQLSSFKVIRDTSILSTQRVLPGKSGTLSWPEELWHLSATVRGSIPMPVYGLPSGLQCRVRPRLRHSQLFDARRPKEAFGPAEQIFHFLSKGWGQCGGASSPWTAPGLSRPWTTTRGTFRLDTPPKPRCTAWTTRLGRAHPWARWL